MSESLVANFSSTCFYHVYNILFITSQPIFILFRSNIQIMFMLRISDICFTTLHLSYICHFTTGCHFPKSLMFAVIMYHLRLTLTFLGGNLFVIVVIILPNKIILKDTWALSGNAFFFFYNQQYYLPLSVPLCSKSVVVLFT